jgi:hypothetical protein
MNRYFKLSQEVEGKLPAIATSYKKRFVFSHLTVPLKTRGKKKLTLLDYSIRGPLISSISPEFYG